MTDRPLCVVGVGASAGGIDAFHRFFDNMPADSGLAFVVVLHLAAGRKSMLPEILARWTTMKVTEAQDGDAVVPNAVLVIPPGTTARLRDFRLSLGPVPLSEPRGPSVINTFFDSMAASLGEDAIGVVLSGTGHDGALGLKAIKARGGLTLAQGSDGSSPEYPEMANSAVAAGAVDLHVPVEQMPGHILGARDVRLALPPEAEQSGEETDNVHLAICGILHSRLGHDFSQYKRTTFMRRVRRRMQVLRLSREADYIRRLKEDREQVILLFRDLLISVTSFFRDTAAFAALEKQVIPRLFEGKDASDEVRIWVPGCATGEEAYSLAILLREHMDTLSTIPSVQVFASDIDEVSVANGRAGRYPSTLMEGMAPERRARFFEERDGEYVVRPEIRGLCMFSTHSLIRDPPFSRMDLISCRNLLIYMDSGLQDHVIPIFHYALVRGGFLVLGASETITRQERLFQPLDRRHRIFVRQDNPRDTSGISHVVKATPPAGVGAEVVDRPEQRGHGAKNDWPKAIAIANRRILERFASPFVVVNADGEVAHFSAHTGRFLQPAPGAPSNNLFTMARGAWGLELRSALRRCIESDRPVEHQCATVDADGEQSAPVRLIVEPLPTSGSAALYVIVFVEAGSSRPSDRWTPETAVLAGGEAVTELERENRELRGQLQSIAEDHSTMVEELRSANEELQSVNEELQSANEELETSREEIQSINEELNTVNVQLTDKVEQLDRSNGDLRNLFESTKVATLFLDRSLLIRSFTPEIANVYNLIPSDLGRPLTDIVGRLTYTTLREDVQTVLRTAQPLEKRVERQDASTHYLMRILPYRGPDNAIDGTLITFVDVTSIVRAEQHQRLLVDELNHRVKNMLTVVISLATNTLRRATGLDDFGEGFLGRLHALNGAYALLSRDGWSPIPLRDILTQELRPFMDAERANVALSGPVVRLPPRAALALGMAVHELTTNAVKYGALSVPEGNVEITWNVEDAGNVEHETDQQYLVLRWVERNGPRVIAPGRRGFGTILIERGFAHDVGGTVTLAYEPEGVVATLRAPVPAT